jgi:hypothetical protein
LEDYVTQRRICGHIGHTKTYGTFVCVIVPILREENVHLKSPPDHARAEHVLLRKIG